MTSRCRLTRKSLIITGIVMSSITLIIAAIIMGVLIANRNRSIDNSKSESDLDIESHQSPITSALSDSNDIHCASDNRLNRLIDHLDDPSIDHLWPLIGPLIPECNGKMTVETFDNEQAANTAWTTSGRGGVESPKLVLPSEKEIAQQGHYAGIHPIHYNLSVNILNEQQFEGRVDILFRVIERTDRVMLDVDLDALQISADEIMLRQFCSNEPLVKRPIDLCLMKLVKLQKRQTFILQFNTHLETKERYVLTIGQFRGTPLTRLNDPNQKYQGSVGLRLADKDNGAWSLTTIFQMRYARTVFPCLDHPSMKAHFTLSIERPIDTLSASNMMLDNSEPVSGHEQERHRDHYRMTPQLPPYVVTFSVMRRYSVSTNDTKNNDTIIQLYYPDTGQNADPTYLWIVGETRQIMKRIEEAVRFKYGQEKLAFINVNPAPFWGIENYGLVTLESGFSRYPEIERGHTILVHEIVHQWLGDVVTISSWDEICLQEGLTAYFEWKLSERLPAVQTTLQLQAKRARAENMRKDEMNGQPLIRPYNKTDDIAEVCFGKPPLIFHMIADAYGGNVWELFLSKLLTEHAYSNADFETWISAIISVTRAKETGEFLRQWFNEPGHPVLYVSIQKSDPTQIQIDQGLVLNSEIISNPQKPRYVPVRILTQLKLEEPVFVNTLHYVHRVQQSANWVLADPDSVTFTRKVYTVSNYRSILECLPPANRADTPLSPECKGATRERIHEAFDDFCFAMFKNTFPWGSDQREFDRSAWVGLFDRLHNATTMARGQRRLQVDRACECCFRTKEELDKEAGMSAWHPLACKRMWNEMCRNLQIMQMTGRNYTAPDKERQQEQRRIA